MNNSDKLLHHLHQTTRIVAKGVNRLLEPWGLFCSEWSIIRILKLNGPQTQRALATFLHIEPPAVTKSLAKLEQKGLIDRNEGMDRRTKKVSLSEKALRLYPEWEKLVGKHRSALLDGLSKEKQVDLRNLLTNIRENALKFEATAGIKVDQQ